MARKRSGAVAHGGAGIIPAPSLLLTTDGVNTLSWTWTGTDPDHWEFYRYDPSLPNAPLDFDSKPGSDRSYTGLAQSTTFNYAMDGRDEDGSIIIPESNQVTINGTP